MPDLYTVKVLRPCVVNRAPRLPGDIVEHVVNADKNGLVYHKKAEVVGSIDAAEKVEADRAAKVAAKKAPAKKATKKAAKKATD